MTHSLHSRTLPNLRARLWIACSLLLLIALGCLTDANGQTTYGYTGAEVSGATHLSYNRARYYDPETGTYLSQDPAGANAGPNNYTYCGDNPVNTTDSLGLDPSSQLFYSSWYFWAGSDTDPDNQGANQVPTWAGTQKQVYVGMINAYSDPMNYAPVVFGVLGGEALESEGLLARGSLRIGGTEASTLGTETLFRTMTVEDLQALMSTNTVPATAETFTSPSLQYASQYNGVTVQINLNPGTISQLADIGVADNSKVVLAAYPDMQSVTEVDSWTDTNAYFKGESGNINIGLGQGPALDILNNNIVSFGVVDADGNALGDFTFPNITSDANSGGVLNLGGGLTIGGVLINEAATLVGENLSDIKGATYDPTSKQIIFLGSSNVNATTSINMDYFYTAVQAVYGSAVPPYVSLDFPATPSTPWTDYGNADGTWETGETNGFTMRYNPLWANVDTTIDVPVIANWNGTNYSFTLHFQAYQLTTTVGGRPGMGLIYTGADNLPSGISLSNQSLFSTGQTPSDFSLTATSQDGHWPVQLYNNSGHSLNVTGFAVIPARQHREYGGRVDGTRLGWVMYEADRVMKCLAVGYDPLSGTAYSSKTLNVPGYYNMGELDASMNDPGGFSRMWFEPNQMTLQRYIDPATGQATINFQTSTVSLFTENYLEGIPSDAAAQAFVTQFQNNYDSFAALNFPVLDPTDPNETRIIRVPIFAMLKQAMQAVSLARFFHDNSIPLDQSWMSTYQLPATYTPKSVPTARNASGSLLIYGGVQIVTPNGYLASPGQGGAQGVGQAVVTSRPNVPDPAHSSQDLKQQSWSASTQSQGTLNAVATSLTPSSQNGITHLTQRDIAFVSPGQLPLTFTRYYQSSYTGNGNMGPGWRYPRYNLQFTSPSWYDQHHYMKDSGGNPIATDVNSDTRLRSGTVRVMDNDTGSELDFQSSLTLAYSTDIHNNPVVTINGLGTGDVPTFTSGAHHNGATLAQSADSNKYYTLNHPDGSWVKFDNNGNILETMDRHGYSQSYSYDSLGRLSTITDSTTPTPQVITLAYDPTSGLLSSATGPNNVGMTYHYTGGLLSAAVHTKTGVAIAQYGYNTSNQLVSVTDATGAKVLSSTPDLKGRSTIRTNARGNSATWSYFQDGAGNRVTQSYDANSGLSYREQDADSSGRITASRDPLGNWTRYGYTGSAIAPTSVQPPTPSDLQTPGTRPAITIQRNDAGLPLTITDPAVPSAQPVQIQYTTANLPQHMSDPAGRAADFYYTNSKNLQKIRNYHNGQNVDTVFGYQNEFLTSAADPMNHTWNYGRDSQGRMTSVTDPMGVMVRYDYDASGRLWHVYDPKLSSAVTYGYDDLNRITSVATPSGTQTFAYDPIHQWVDSATTTTTDGQVTTVQYTRNNQTGDVTSAATTYQNPPVAGGGTQTVTTNYSYTPYGYLQTVTPQGADPINYNVNPLGQVSGSSEANGPTISANHASDGVWTNANSQAFTWTPSSDAPAATGYNYAEDSSTTTQVNTTNATATWNSISDGQHTFAVRQVDANGNWSSETDFHLLVDTTTPTITFQNITPNPIVQGITTPVTVAATITDAGSGLAGVPQFRWCISANSSRPWSSYAPMALAAGNQWTGALTYSSFANHIPGEVVYYQIQATDIAGNTASYSGSTSVSGPPPTFAADVSFGVVPTKLILANDGNYYGICTGGGQQLYGTVYRYTPAGVVSVLHSFTGTDGVQPNCLIQGTDGNLYGTCSQGGSSFSATTYAQNGASAYGTLFKLSLTGTYTTICSFPGTTAGSRPSTILRATDGNFYGLCQGGNNHDAYNGAEGMVYKITPSGTLSTFVSFGDTNNPPTSLIQASDGNLYGTTGNGLYVTGSGKGDYVVNAGTIFQLTLNGTLTTFFDFSELSAGFDPISLMEASNGVLYGTTAYGGNGGGLVFSITKDGYYQTLYTTNIAGNTNVWIYPYAPASLTQGPNGILYGEGPTNWYTGDNVGGLFSMPIAGTLSTLCSLNGYGANPAAPLVIGGDGTLYGTTTGGGGPTPIDGTLYNANQNILPWDYTDPFSSENAATESILVDFNGKAATIGTQPAPVQYVFTGQPATFSVVVATGVPPYSYQWQFNGTNIPSATSSTYTIPSVASANYGSYQVVITDLAGSITSNTALLSAPFIQISTQPSSVTVPAGGTATLSVAATVSGTITYQWQRLPAGGSTWTNLTDGGSYTGSATSSLTVTPTATSMSGDQFRCQVSNSYGQNQTSNPATLTVPVLVINFQPTSLTVNGGQSASFGVGPSSNATISYQWQREASGSNTWVNLSDGGNYSGTTSGTQFFSTLVVSSTTIAMNGDQFRCVLTNTYGSVTSNAVTLSVVPLTFTTQPHQSTVYSGQSATFSAAVTGTGPFTYQWQFNGVNIPGATGATYTINNVSSSNAGTYTVIATDSYGSVTSSGAVLTVNQASPGGGDTPLLPPWGYVVLAALLFMMGMNSRRRTLE